MTKLLTQHEPPELAVPFHPFALFNGPALEANLKASETYAKAWLAWQQEVLKFIGNRLQWDSRVGEALAACKSFGDLCEIQKNWFMTTGQDYFEETNRLAQFGWKLMPSLLPPAIIAPHPERTTVHFKAAE